MTDWIQTFPSREVLLEQEDKTPEYMRPNTLPVAVYVEGMLHDDECDAIVKRFMMEDPYKHDGCGAMTRELGDIPELYPLRAMAEMINESFWNYDLDDGTMSWMQTYYSDGDYQLHMDYTPGGMRKLTAVLMLSDPANYQGGDLELYLQPVSVKIPKARGTVAVFQPWLLHRVHPVTRGIRQTINMGFWGPPFR